MKTLLGAERIQAKNVSSYFEQERRELLQFVPPGVRRVLDVGCGAGMFGALVKQTYAAEVWGVEPDPSSHALAASRLDRVFLGDFESTRCERVGEKFDLICFNDVLEHMIDPAHALRTALKELSSQGLVLASIPNFRYFPNLWEIVFKGDWEYKSSGILDATHLRFYTRKSMQRLFECEGYRVRNVHGICPWQPIRFRILKRLSFGALDETAFQAFVVLADAKGQDTP